MKRNKQGFTLIELLVVVGIITLLAALILSVLSRVKGGARKTTCLSNEKQILVALTMYLQDSDDRFPLGVQVASVSPLGLKTWFDTLLPYTKSKEVFQCPSDATLVAGTWPNFPVSYSANQTGSLMTGQTGPRALPSLLLSQVKRPSTTVFLSDAATQTSLEAPYVTTSSPEKKNCWYLHAPTVSPPGSSGAGTDTPGLTYGGPSLRHFGTSNVGFIDGHVKAMNPQQWYYRDTPWLDPKRGGDTNEE